VAGPAALTFHFASELFCLLVCQQLPHPHLQTPPPGTL